MLYLYINGVFQKLMALSHFFLKIVQFFLIPGFVLLTSVPALIAGEGDNAGYAGQRRLPKNSCMFNLDFSNQRNTSIPAIENIAQPYLNTGFTFYSRRNFDLAVEAGAGFNSDTSFSQAAYDLGLSGGYTFDINPVFKLRPSYSHWFYSKNSNFLQTLISDAFQLDLYVQKKWYYGGIFPSLLLGEKNTFMGSIKNGVLFNFDNVLRKQTLLSIGVEANFTFRDRHYFNEIFYDGWNTDEFVYWYANYYGLSDPEIEAFYSRINLEGLETIKSVTRDRLNTRFSDLFDPSYGPGYLDVSFPLFYSTLHWNFYLLPMLMIPLSSSVIYESDVQFIINAGIAVIL